MPLDRCRQSARERRPNAARRRRQAFTLAELLVVSGLVAMLSSLLLPVVGRARAAANATRCLSNLRQIHTGWAMYNSVNRSQLLAYTFRNNTFPDIAWNGYWLGPLEQHGVRGDVLLCPSAFEPVATPESKGYGTADYAWNGKFGPANSSMRLTTTTYRTGSYGFNKHLTIGGGFAPATKLTAIRQLSDVPSFFDCAFVDAAPTPANEAELPQPPPDLQGSNLLESEGPSFSHWRFLLARHGRAINVVFADGSARRVPLEDTYTLTWQANWVPYQIPLPSH
jgi:prepilin-type processing-associated H-X9-DG protein